jgi:hypothetical protein
MARTRGTARKAPVSDAISRKRVTDDEATEEEQPIEQQITEQVTERSTEESPIVDYSKMTVPALKKLLENRNIEGRSKLTTKGAIIKVLEIFDQDPEDKASISALVAEVSTPRKKKSEESSTDEEKPKKIRSSKKKKSEESSSTDEEKPKKDTSVDDKSSEEKKKQKPKKVTKKSKDHVSTEDEEIKKDETSEIRYSDMNIENDTAMQEMLELTRDVLKRMRSIANDARNNEDLKNSWIHDLKEFKKKLETMGSTHTE